MELPVPKNWQDFEDIVCDALALRWNSTTLQKNGRPGQKQNGVDIYGPDDIGRAVAVQCKRYRPPLELKIATDEIGKAEKFNGNLTTLYIATSAPHDAVLQQQVRLLSDKRVAQGKFAVGILFWDDIVRGLVLNPAVMKAHYPQITLQAQETVSKERMVAAVEFGYYGANLWAYVVLVFGEYGWMAQVDPDGIIAHIRILEQRARQLLDPNDANPIIDSLASVREGCLAKKETKSDWDAVEFHAKRASARIQTASSLLPLSESNALELGLQLGRVYHHSDDLPAIETRDRIETMVRSVLPAVSEDHVSKTFASAAKLDDGFRWATRIYSLVDRELRFRL